AELLRQQLAGGPSLQESLGQLAQSDPQLGSIAQLLAQREEQLQRDLERQEQEELLDQQEADRLGDRRQRAAALREHLEGSTAEVESLRARLAEIAEALGACRACFGADRACPWCRGRGGPGFMPPEPDGFNHLVMPAVRLHVRLCRSRINGVDDRAT